MWLGDDADMEVVSDKTPRVSECRGVNASMKGIDYVCCTRLATLLVGMSVLRWGEKERRWTMNGYGRGISDRSGRRTEETRSDEPVAFDVPRLVASSSPSSQSKRRPDN
jgi:hypothetical protein